MKSARVSLSSLLFRLLLLPATLLLLFPATLSITLGCTASPTAAPHAPATIAVLNGIQIITGYLATNRTASEIFYYYVPHADPKAPLVIWLQGGPFCAGMLGGFGEGLIGWLQQDPKTPGNFTLQSNPYSWTQLAHMLFLDQPIGTGFSTPQDPSTDIPNDVFEASDDFFSALQAFHRQHPVLRQSTTFLAGESYAGKWLPYFSSRILNESAVYPISFGGMLLGNGWTWPLLQTQVYANQYYTLGFLSYTEKLQVEAMTSKCEYLVGAEQWAAAQVVCDNVVGYAVNASGGIDEDNLTIFGYQEDEIFAPIEEFMNLPSTKRLFGVRDNAQWDLCAPVTNLAADEMKDASHFLPQILESPSNLRVVLYVGALDMNCGIAGVEAGLRSLVWKGQEDFAAADKCFWSVNSSDRSIAGYARTARNLSLVTVLGSGHLVPHDQPRKAFDIARRFLAGDAFCSTSA